jgi:IS6 family transposase
MLGLTSFRADYMIFAGVEAHAYDKKKRTEQIDLRERSVQNQKQFIYQLFGLTA